MRGSYKHRRMCYLKVPEIQYGTTELCNMALGQKPRANILRKVVVKMTFIVQN